jgi:alkylhydroperoxidase family enzyme
VLVQTALHDLDRAPLEDKEKLMLRFVGKVTKDLPSILGDDIDALRSAGWDDEAIFYAITTCALFNFYNRWISATGVPAMSAEGHRRQGRALASHGYVRD